MDQVLNFYQKRFSQFSEQLTRITSLVDRYSMIRLTVFIIGIVLMYFITTFGIWVSVGYFVLFAVIFGFIVYRHSKLHKLKQKLTHLKKINEDEIAALHGNFENFDAGKEFISSDNHYTDDLDIFGNGSLFQYLNRSSTISGKAKLAHNLLEQVLDPEVILKKQQAVQELAKKPEWRQNFQLIGLNTSEKKEDIDDVKNWLEKTPLINKQKAKIIVFVVNLITFCLFVLSIFNVFPSIIFILYVIIIPFTILGIYFKRINLIHAQLGKKTDLFIKYSDLIRLIEEETFKSEYLKDLKQKSSIDQMQASGIIKKLSKISMAFNQRLNMVAGLLLNMFSLWDLMQYLRLENWKVRHKSKMLLWFDVMAEFDALSSLACFHFNHPEYCFPQPSQTELSIIAGDMGHPLIHQHKRINNDYKIEGSGHFTIITGANMAGKSTFLRTLGTNMILASTGAPVCARSFEWNPVPIFTSIRTRDSLFKNESYFFAELKRLKSLIEQLQSGNRMFIILDEILKGTNSKDKQTGSMHLIEQLIRLKASGIIATHDLVLGKLADTYPENIENMRFEVEFENDELVFDYKLKNGISQNMNATFLMKKMGITM